jgi:hypothetical protein
MTEEQMETLAAWFSGEAKTKRLCRSDVYEQAENHGIEIDLNDCVRLFHFINERKEGQHA